MNDDDAQIVRVYTRNQGSKTPDLALRASANLQFDVVVESEAGADLINNAVPYRLAITPFGITAAGPGANALPAAFAQQTTAAGSNFSVNWTGGHNEQVFTVTMTAADAGNLRNHVVKYIASLTTLGGNPSVVSTADSPEAILV